MATRSSWKGILKLNLATVPVQAYPSNPTDHGTDDSKAILIQEFIAPSALDPIYWGGPTDYLVPDGPAAQRPYAVLRQAMTEQNRYAIAQVDWHGNKQVVLLRPLERLIAMTSLSYAHQVTKPAVLEELIPSIDVAFDELKLAKTLIDGNTSRKFDFSKYTDTFNCVESIDTNIAFMDALKQSVAEQTEARPGKKLAPSKPAPSSAKQKKTS
jgi:non-homologous end joining protein Ku